MTGPITRLRRGPAAGDLSRLVRAERRAATTGTAPGPSTLGNAEVSVLVSIDDTLAREDARWGRRLLRDQRRLIAAAHVSQLARQRLRAVAADPRWAAWPARASVDAPIGAPLVAPAGVSGHPPPGAPVGGDPAADAATQPVRPATVGGPVHGAGSLARATVSGNGAGPASNGAGPASNGAGAASNGAGRAGGAPDARRTAAFGAATVAAGPVAGPAEPFDTRQPLIRERTLAAVEFVFVVVEFFFWYNVFGADVQPGAAWTDPTRISDLLLAALVPVSGIIAARVVGALGHRLVSGYPGLGRSVGIGSACATVLAVLSLTAVYLLVHARFDASTRPLGATPLPAVAMTLVFVVVLLGDMLARTFLLSEIRAQTRAWHCHIDRLLARAAAANDAHARAWTTLRTQAQVRLDRCERIVAAGARIIGDQRAVAGGWPPELPTLVWAPRPAHAPTGVPTGDPTGDPTGGTPADPPAVPCVEQLQLYGAPLMLGPLRSVADAVDTLRRWPPYDQRGLGEYLDEMAGRLFRLSAAPAADEPAATGGTS